jgi:hypothetical protein
MSEYCSPTPPSPHLAAFLKERFCAKSQGDPSLQLPTTLISARRNGYHRLSSQPNASLRGRARRLDCQSDPIALASTRSPTQRQRTGSSILLASSAADCLTHSCILHRKFLKKHRTFSPRRSTLEMKSDCDETRNPTNCPCSSVKFSTFTINLDSPSVKFRRRKTCQSER